MEAVLDKINYPIYDEDVDDGIETYRLIAKCKKDDLETDKLLKAIANKRVGIRSIKKWLRIIL